jgi:cell division protein ZapA (FtsZ GTPase activity inhibitor)
MAETKTIHTELNIAGRIFPVELTESEHAMTLELVDAVNVTFKEFQKQYPSQEKLDLVIMAFLKSHSEHFHKAVNDKNAIGIQIDTLERLLT